MFHFTIKKDLDTVIELVESKYQVQLPNTLSYSDFEEYDYQSSMLFKVSKHPNKDAIYDDIISFLLNTGHYLKVEQTGKGFLSLVINPNTCLDIDGTTEEKTVIVDYCGVNVAKKMHIGHIRSMFIGDYISNHYEYLGNKVIRFNHIGDWGNQFGYLLHYMESNNIQINNNEQLTTCYKKAYSLYSTDAEFAKNSNIVAQKLFSYEEPYFQMWKDCCDISIQEMNKTTLEFNLHINENDIKGESFYAPHLPEIEQILLNKGIITPGEDGSIVYHTKNKYPLMLKKSNGAYLYAMYDIAAIYYRIFNYDPDKIIYVVDKRQSDHFKALFELAHQMELDKNCEFKHVAFGFILGEDGKPLKTKSGENLYLDELIKTGFQEISKNPFYDKFSNPYKNEVLSKTLYGSLKWYDLHTNFNTDYQFKWEHILNNSAGTAPYILHAYARITSVLFKNEHTLKSNETSTDFDNFDVNSLSFSAINLYKKGQYLNESLYLNLNEHSSHKIEEHLMDVVKSFHSLYETTNILSSDNKQDYIKLLHFIKSIIEDTCSVLGLELYPSQAVWNYEHTKDNKNIHPKI